MIIHNTVRKDKITWHPITEQPPLDTSVLVNLVFETGVRLVRAFELTPNGWTDGEDYFTLNVATHWALIPEPEE